MKKLSVLRAISLFALLLVLLPCCTLPAQAITYTPPVNITVHSESALLISLDTDQVLYEKNADQRMVPASLVKIMVAILTLESGEDIDTVEITSPSYIYDMLWGMGASTADIRPRETLTVRNYLYGLMLQSAAEAALALADHYGDGSVDYFVEQMNRRAQELGCTGTHFVNPHGLYDPDQYTTARDMAILARHAMSLPGFMDIVSTYTIDIGPSNKHDSLQLWSTIKLMSKSSEYYYEPVRGIKSGTLDESGRCLVTTASQDGFNYLLVTLGAPLYDESGAMLTDRLDYKDHINLYEWAFRTFRVKTLMEAGRNLTEIPVRLSFQQDYVKLSSGEKFTDLVPDAYDAADIVAVPVVPDSLDAPIEKGQEVGYARLLLADEEIGRVKLVTTQAVERSQLLYLLDKLAQLSRSYWFKFAVVLFVLLVCFYLFVMIVRNRNNRRYRRVRPRRRI